MPYRPNSPRCAPRYSLNASVSSDDRAQIRFRGDQKAADAVYEGMTPLTGEDIAEEILWIASRPAHVNVAESFVLPVSQARCVLARSLGLMSSLTSAQSCSHASREEVERR